VGQVCGDGGPTWWQAVDTVTSAQASGLALVVPTEAILAAAGPPLVTRHRLIMIVLGPG
jgi:hypothetical protein